MDIPLLDGGLDRFQNPNLLARLINLSGSIWTLGAVVLAAVAAFSSAIRRNNFIILRRRRSKLAIHHHSEDDEISCCSSDDDDDDDEEEEEEELTSSGEEDEAAIDADERDDRTFWSEILSGGGIVKAWEGIGLGFNRSGGSGSGSGSISLLDLNRGEILRSFFAEKGEIPAVDLASPAVVLSANPTAVRLWDARGGGLTPSASATWRPGPRRRVVGVAGGENGRVYVSDDDGTVTAVDLRGIRSPSCVTWWDADAVMVGDGDGF